jgi:5-(carboxyamino)imidazole ribonucleotide mutase
MKKAAIVMGSDSDLPVVEKAFKKLKDFDIPFEAHVMSAHRTPERAADFAKNARKNGFGVIIAAAGMAAHLAGAIAANTTLPVIGIPIKSTLDGLDALLATVQMPPGIPVATVAVDGAENAAILAAQILAAGDDALCEKLAEKLAAMKIDMENKVIEKDKQLQEKLK